AARGRRRAPPAREPDLAGGAPGPRALPTRAPLGDRQPRPRARGPAHRAAPGERRARAAGQGAPAHPRRPPGAPRPLSYPSPMPKPTRADAEALLFEFTQSDALRKHGRAVEEAMRAYAGWYGVTDPQAVEDWGIVGLLHDFDYEQNPTEDTHLHVGREILRARGYSGEIIEAV